MKIAVAGTFIRDLIFPWQGEATKSVGGLFFTTSYLANLVSSEAQIVPVCFIGEDFFEEVKSNFQNYSNLSFEGFNVLPRKNTAVTLTYTSPKKRQEKTTAPMPPIEFEQLNVVLDANAIIVNLISGTDVSLQALQEFREKSKAKVYLDFHSHALGIDENGKRYYSKPEDWKDWVALADFIQLNEMEAATLAGILEERNPESLLSFGAELLELGPTVSHITLGAKGSCLNYKTQKEVVSKFMAPVSVPKAIDIIGCGDSFEAAFLVKLLDGEELEDATKFAHKVAAANSTFVGSNGIKKILEII